MAARKTPRIIATYLGSIYGDFLYLGDYSNINNYNIFFHFCQYICLKFWSMHKKLNPQKRCKKTLYSVSVTIISRIEAFVNFFPAPPQKKIRQNAQIPPFKEKAAKPNRPSLRLQRENTKRQVRSRAIFRGLRAKNALPAHAERPIFEKSAKSKCGYPDLICIYT